MKISLISFKQLQAAKLLLLHAIPLDANNKDMQIHSSELRRALQMGGGDFLLDHYQHESNKGLVRLLNRIVNDQRLIPNSNKSTLVGVWNCFANGMYSSVRFTL